MLCTSYNELVCIKVFLVSFSSFSCYFGLCGWTSSCFFFLTLHSPKTRIAFLLSPAPLYLFAIAPAQLPHAVLFPFSPVSSVSDQVRSERYTDFLCRISLKAGNCRSFAVLVPFRSREIENFLVYFIPWCGHCYCL